MDSNLPPAVRVERVTKRFGAVAVVRDVSFCAQRGSVLGLLGPNGAGKTTTLRMIMGTIAPDEGSIGFHLGAAAGLLNKERVGYLPEERGLYPDATVMATLVYLAQLKGLARTEARRRALDWLDRLDLTAWANRRIETLSKGMEQKVQLAAALLHEPDLVVLDEPFSGLDPVHQDFVNETIRDLRRSDKAVLLSSHMMNQVERLTDEISLLDHGRIVLQGTIGDVKEAHGVRTVSLRFGGDPALLRQDTRVEGLCIEGDRAKFRLSRGVTVDAYVRDIPRGIIVREISVAHAVLHDIFVDTVARREG